jgi:regulation of enolase protein 1 (concanavalin A-like superfamily)
MKPGRLSGLTACLGVLALGLSLPAQAAISGWTDKSVNTSAAGSATADASGVWTVQGSGGQMWEQEDGFHFVFKPLAGDGSVTTRLITAPDADGVKVGIMMRDVVDDPGSKTITLQRSGGGLGGESVLRAVSGDTDQIGAQGNRMGKDRKMCPDGNANLFPASQLPIWLKIERHGDYFTPYASTDGAAWVPVGRAQRIKMASSISAGVFVCSGSDGDLQSATFDGNATDVSGKLLKPEEAAPLQPNPLIVLGGDNQVLLMWDRVNHLGKEADGYVIYRTNVGDVTATASFTKLAELPGDQTSFIDTTIKNGQIARYRVTTIAKVGPAADKVLESRGMTNLLYEVSGAPNPPITAGGRQFFANVMDCGGNHELTDKPGSASIDGSGVVTLTASGWDIQEEADGGEELMTPVSGDFTFTVRVLGVPTQTNGSDADEWAKFGIAVRETTMAESRNACMLITPQHGIRSPHRRSFNCGRTEDTGPNQDLPDFPIYFRIQRRGEQLNVFTSADGKTFNPYGEPESVLFPDLLQNVYVGFVGTAGGVQMPITQAKFDQVTLTSP